MRKCVLLGDLIGVSSYLPHFRGKEVLEYVTQAHHDREAGENPIKRRKNSNRKSKTQVPVTDEDINKLFFERDVLLDKLARRDDDITALRAGLPYP